MADETKVILFKVELDTTDLDREATAAVENLNRLKEEQKSLDTTTDAGAIAYQKYQAAIQNAKKEVSELTRIQANQIKAEKDGLTSQRGLQAAYSAAQAQLKRLQGTLKQNADGTYELTDAYKAQEKEIERMNAALKAFDGGLGQNQRNVGNYENSIVGIKNEIIRLRESMQTMDLNSKEFNETRDAADNLQLSIDQAIGKVDEFGNREPRNPAKKVFDDSLESATALSGAFGLLSSLTGDNEDAQEKLAKAMEAVAIAQAAANILKAKGAITDTVTLLATKSMTLAQRAYTVAIGQTSGALRVFRGALAATGIGLIVIALVEAAKAMNLFGSSTDEAADEQQRLNEEIETTNRKLEEQAGISSAQSNADIRQLERRKKIMEAEGATAQQLFEIERDILTKRIAIQGQLAFSLIEGTKEQIEALQVYYDLQADLKVLELDFNRERREQAPENIKEAQDLTDALTIQRDVIATIATDWERIAEVLATLNEKTYPELKDISGQTIEQNKRLSDEAAEQEAARLKGMEALADLSQDVAVQVGKAFSDSIDEAGFQTEEFMRRLLILTLDVLQRQLLVAIAEIYFNQIASKGFAGIATGAALTAIIVGATEAAKAAVEKPVKFALGGEYDPMGVDVGGRLHSQGGTKYYGEDGNVIELERGEKIFVNNRKSSEFIRALATINQVHGGKGLTGQSSYLADGGFAARAVSSEINNQFRSAQLAADIVKNLPEFTVSVSEINRATGAVRVVDSAISL